MKEKIITLKIIPNSKVNKVVEQKTDYLKIKLTAQAQAGKANKALLDFLSKYYKIPKSRITILRGLKNREKVIKILLSS